MKRVSLDELMEMHSGFSYRQHYAYIMELLAAGKLKPVKSAGTNGKSPALCLSYWMTEEDQPYGDVEEELKFQLEPLISIEYYLAHLVEYQKDRKWVLLLDEYLKTKRMLIEQPESVNERSFEIWNREKFLSKEQGKKILKRCGMDAVFFNMYETAEPLSYYSNSRKTPQILLILENKDTFFSMRKALLDGKDGIFGVEIGTLIYGGGKRIVKSFQDFELSAEPYMKCDGNQIYYFGDLDYEGIGIYESLAQQCKTGQRPTPFVAAYEKMLKKAKQAAGLPDTKEQQNRNMGREFFSHFSKETAAQMLEILEREKYIPQEILNISDF